MTPAAAEADGLPYRHSGCVGDGRSSGGLLPNVRRLSEYVWTKFVPRQRTTSGLLNSQAAIRRDPVFCNPFLHGLRGNLTNTRQGRRSTGFVASFSDEIHRDKPKQTIGWQLMVQPTVGFVKARGRRQ